VTVVFEAVTDDVTIPKFTLAWTGGTKNKQGVKQWASCHP
jgi:hypothetical protein